LLIYNRGCWTLPKGHVDKGETILAAAIREVQEETGLQTVQAGAAIIPTYHTFWQPKKKRWVYKTTHWFHNRADSAQPHIPQADEHIEAVAWHSKAEWLQVAPDSYPLNRHLFSQVFTQSLIS
ncbi:MAG: NUDIX domain-containing protein, partial [Bacteroidota bacterium]